MNTKNDGVILRKRMKRMTITTTTIITIPRMNIVAPLLHGDEISRML